MAKIGVRVIRINNGFFSPPKIVNKKLNEVITIGREEGNDIVCSGSFISSTHGRIFSKKVIFRYLYYRDESKNGTTVIHWDGPKSRSEFVHNGKVKINKNDWILLLENGINGIFLIPFFY